MSFANHPLLLGTPTLAAAGPSALPAQSQRKFGLALARLTLANIPASSAAPPFPIPCPRSCIFSAQSRRKFILPSSVCLSVCRKGTSAGSIAVLGILQLRLRSHLPDCLPFAMPRLLTFPSQCKHPRKLLLGPRLLLPRQQRQRGRPLSSALLRCLSTQP
jgi:hypothetical protein